jgi:hypothetical protein
VGLARDLLHETAKWFLKAQAQNLFLKECSTMIDRTIELTMFLAFLATVTATILFA